MLKFKCCRGGHCCTRQLSMTDGKEHGIYLTPEEAKYFPPETVFPLFRSGAEVFAYQLGVHECPNLVRENGHMACKIYEHRPLICKSFPLGQADNGDLIVLADRCESCSKATRGSPSEEWDMTSFADCFAAMREQIDQANRTPQATEMFVLNGKTWRAL